jgi:hypothetical protein
MSEREVVVRFHDWRAATGPQGRDTPPLALTLHQAGGACIDWAGRPGAGGRHVSVVLPAAHSGAELPHRPLTYRIIQGAGTKNGKKKANQASTRSTSAGIALALDPRSAFQGR